MSKRGFFEKIAYGADLHLTTSRSRTSNVLQSAII